MFQGGVTDIATAKMVARRLYTQYCSGSQMERASMERMLVDTYKIMVKLQLLRIKITSPPIRTSIFTTTYSISTATAGSRSRISRGSPSSTWPVWKRSNLKVIQVLYKEREGETAGGAQVVREIRPRQERLSQLERNSRVDKVDLQYAGDELQSHAGRHRQLDGDD